MKKYLYITLSLFFWPVLVVALMFAEPDIHDFLVWLHYRKHIPGAYILLDFFYEGYYFWLGYLPGLAFFVYGFVKYYRYKGILYELISILLLIFHILTALVLLFLFYDEYFGCRTCYVNF